MKIDVRNFARDTSKFLFCISTLQRMTDCLVSLSLCLETITFVLARIDHGRGQRNYGELGQFEFVSPSPFLISRFGGRAGHAYC